MADDLWTAERVREWAAEIRNEREPGAAFSLEKIADAMDAATEIRKHHEAGNAALRREVQRQYDLAAAAEARAEKAERERDAARAEMKEALTKAAEIAGDAFWSRPMPADWERGKDAYTDWCATQSKFVRQRIAALTPARNEKED